MTCISEISETGVVVGLLLYYFRALRTQHTPTSKPGFSYFVFILSCCRMLLMNVYFIKFSFFSTKLTDWLEDSPNS